MRKAEARAGAAKQRAQYAIIEPLGRSSVEMHLEQQEPADVSSQLVKLIRKLRWMGMQEEVERVQMRLAQCPVPPADSVLATPHDTD